MSRMKIACLSGLGAMMLCGAAWAAPAAPAARPAAAPVSRPTAAPEINAYLVEPELVLRFGTQAGVDQAVVDAVAKVFQDQRAKLEEAQQKLRTDTAALNELVRQDQPDAKACLAQLDKVLEDERVIKRMNLELALLVKAKLTPDQIARLIQLRNQQLAVANNAGGAPEALRAKMQQVQTLAQARQQDGRDLTEVRRLMQQVRTAVQAGRYHAADQMLDQISGLLGQPSTSGTQLGPDAP
jgi:hypothetical protein